MENSQPFLLQIFSSSVFSFFFFWHSNYAYAILFEIFLPFLDVLGFFFKLLLLFFFFCLHFIVSPPSVAFTSVLHWRKGKIRKQVRASAQQEAAGPGDQERKGRNASECQPLKIFPATHIGEKFKQRGSSVHFSWLTAGIPFHLTGISETPRKIPGTLSFCSQEIQTQESLSVVLLRLMGNLVPSTSRSQCFRLQVLISKPPGHPGCCSLWDSPFLMDPGAPLISWGPPALVSLYP